MEYNIKLSKGKININGKDYDIPREVAEFTKDMEKFQKELAEDLKILRKNGIIS